MFEGMEFTIFSDNLMAAHVFNRELMGLPYAADPREGDGEDSLSSSDSACADGRRMSR